jgi:hypothetical protein
MYLDPRRLREEQVMRDSGPACACGRRSWKREPIRDPNRRRFRCTVCLTVLNVPAELFAIPKPDEHQQTA